MVEKKKAYLVLEQSIRFYEALFTSAVVTKCYTRNPTLNLKRESNAIAEAQASELCSQRATIL